MDANRFDHLARSLSTAGTRRGVLSLLTAMPLLGGAPGVLPPEDAAAKGRRKRRKARNRHGKNQKKSSRRRQRGQRRKKVTLCHDGQTIRVRKSKRKKHLRHGDTRGACQTVPPPPPGPPVTPPVPPPPPPPPPPPDCDPGSHRCDGGCVPGDSVEHCGDRCEPCPTSPCSPATCDGTTCGRAPITGCCEDDRDCGDGDVCTSDTCTDHTCVHDHAPPTTPCGSGDAGICCAGACCEAPADAEPTCVGATCGFACIDGFHDCGGACVRDDSINHCGTACTPCDPPANATATCDGTTCGFSCNAGFHDCGGACVSNNSVDHCGASCAPCQPPANATATCNGTTCGFACNTGYHPCGIEGACYADNDAAHCGPGCTVCDAECQTCNGTACVAVSNDTSCNTGHCCNGVCPPNPCPGNANCGTAQDACGRAVSCGVSCANPTPVCVDNVCTACSDSRRCESGCCSGGMCVATCPSCHSCVNGVCTPCPVCCNGSCCDGCCDSSNTCGACLVFITSTPHNGILGGLAGADAICQNLAANAAKPLPGTYRAWLSAGDGQNNSPANGRFHRSAREYRLVGGTTVANNWQDLTSGSLKAAISRDESGASVDPSYVWSNTTTAGNRIDPDQSCSGWTSASFDHHGRFGNSGYASEHWTQGWFDRCFYADKRLYCFQQD